MARRRQLAEQQPPEADTLGPLDGEPITDEERLHVLIWIDPDAPCNGPNAQDYTAEMLLAWARAHAPEYVVPDEAVIAGRRCPSARDEHFQHATRRR